MARYGLALLVAFALLCGHTLASSPGTCPGGVCAWSGAAMGPTVKCMELSAKCGPATHAAYDSQDITPLLQCASLSDLCACAEADLFPQDVGAFVSAVCSTTANIASALSAGASHTESAAHAISTVYHGIVNVTRRSPGKLRLGAGAGADDADEATEALGCIVPPYGRGVGSVIDTCPSGTEKNGALCYPLCRGGYTGVGPVCWQNCPADFTDIGAFCQKPAPYGRGAGYPWKFGDGFNLDGAMARCRAANRQQGCEVNGAIVYPKCRAGYHNVGCCVCSPDCPAGMTDTGTGCAKDSYGRTAGTPLGCSAGLELSGALCYPPCKATYSGVGPVCWATECPAHAPFKCSPFCATSQENCDAVTSELMKQGLNLVKLIGKVAMCIASEGASVDSCLQIALGLGETAKYVMNNFPTC